MWDASYARMRNKCKRGATGIHKYNEGGRNNCQGPIFALKGARGVAQHRNSQARRNRANKLGRDDDP